MKKKRKPRGIKADGSRSLDMCPCCLSFHCDPGTMSFNFYVKTRERMRAGLCPSCGNNPCKCKSSLDIKQGDVK